MLETTDERFLRLLDTTSTTVEAPGKHSDVMRQEKRADKYDCLYRPYLIAMTWLKVQYQSDKG